MSKERLNSVIGEQKAENKKSKQNFEPGRKKKSRIPGRKIQRNKAKVGESLKKIICIPFPHFSKRLRTEQV